MTTVAPEILPLSGSILRLSALIRMAMMAAP